MSKFLKEVCLNHAGMPDMNNTADFEIIKSTMLHI